MSKEKVFVKNKVDVGYVHCFADDYLTTLHFLLKQAKNNNKDYLVFTYTLPILLIGICFLEANINNIISLFSIPNNIFDYKSKNGALTQQICDDFIHKNKEATLNKYYIILKYYKNVNLKREHNKYYQKVKKIIELRNLLVHDKSYTIFPSNNEKNKIVNFLEHQTWLKPNYNLTGIVPDWLTYLEYKNTCLMLKAIFEFYLDYSKLLIPEEEPIYQNKIERIISRHELLKNLDGIN